MQVLGVKESTGTMIISDASSMRGQRSLNFGICFLFLTIYYATKVVYSDMEFGRKDINLQQNSFTVKVNVL